MEIILPGLFCLFFLIQLSYYWIIYSRPGFIKPARKNAPHLPVSIIICARDEAANLEQFLPSVLSQDYPDYEVIVVNDCSEDNSQEVLETLQSKYPHLHVSVIKKDAKFSHGKKFALLIGIKAARHEWLLLTDADCRAGSPRWLATMQKNFTASTDIVLGYGGYQERPGLLNKYIRYDTVFIAMQYLGFTMAGIPYMGVGRNLAYRKSFFFKNRGFSGHAHLDSGDDDLFVNRLATRSNTQSEYSPDSHIRSVPKTGFSTWYKQKTRHLTTGKHYKPKDKFLLGGEVFSRVLFYILAVYLLATGWFPGLVLIPLLVRILSLLVVFKSAMIRLEEKHLLLYSLIFDMVSPLLNLAAFVSGLTSDSRSSWK